MLRYRRFTSFVLTLGLAVLVALALLISAVRLVLPFADGYRGALENTLSQRLGYRVSLGKLTVHLSGWEPRLILDQVLLSDPRTGVEAFRLKAVELDLDAVGSLRMASPQFRRLTLLGAHLVLEQSREGRLRLVGFEALKSDHPEALALFLEQGQINLIESEILFVDVGRGDAPLRLADVSLQLRNDGWSHQLQLSARPVTTALVDVASIDLKPPSGAQDLAGHGSSVNRLDLTAELVGPPVDPWSWTGHLYTGLAGTDLGELVPAELLNRQTLDTGNVLLEGWHRIRDGRLEQSLLRIDLAELIVNPSDRPFGPAGTLDERSPIALRHFQALARVRPQASGWRVEVSDLNTSIGGADLSGLGVDLLVSGDGQVSRLALAASQLDLEDLAEILRASPWRLPETVVPLIEARPRGQLTDLRFRIEGRPSTQQNRPYYWKVSAMLSDVEFQRTPSTPGIVGLCARLSADRNGGELRFGSDGLLLDLRPLFSAQLKLDQFSGWLDWRRDTAGVWQMFGRNINLENADLAGRVRFGVSFPVEGGSPILDLRASFHDGVASQVRSYLPVGIMAPDLVRWLTESIVSGSVTEAEMVFRGPLSDYPFRKQQGRFELILTFEDLLLDYQKGWPPIASAAGYLRFLNQSLDIRVERGRIYDSAFTGGEALIPDLWGPEHLRIHGEAEGPFSDGLRTLTETPLAKDLGRLSEVMSVSGDSRLVLEIDLPLVTHGHLGVAGQLTWPAPATLSIQGTPFSLSELGGTLSFTENGLDTKSLSARLWGKPVSLSIVTEGAGDPDTSRTRIGALARTQVDELARRFPNPLWKSLKGHLDWDLAVTLRNRDVSHELPALGYRLSSRLQGMSIDLPPPLGKPANMARDLDLTGTLVPGQSMEIAGRVGDLATSLELELDKAKPRLTGGHLRFGANSAPSPERPGLILDGTLTELDLPVWMDWLEGWQRRSGVKSGSSTTVLSVDGDPWLAGVRLSIERLRLGDLELNGLALDMNPPRDGWEVQVRADELAGRVRFPLPLENRFLDLEFDRLDLKPLLSRPKNDREKRLAADQSGRSMMIPSLDLRVTDLHWGQASLGSLDLSLRNDLSGIRLPRLTLGGTGLLSVTGDGEWLRSRSGGQSRVELALEAADLGALLRVLDDKSSLEARSVAATLQLNWQGGFGDFDWPRADGVIDLKVGGGRLLGVEPGLGRLLGFMNFAALNRRLALDFTDLYGAGFAFEEMVGRIAIGDGKAGFNGFNIDGPAGKVMVDGLTDLMARRFDQTVTVEPKLGSSVALASAVAGGPVIGAAVYLVDRVAGNPIDRLGRYRYRVTGPWSEPEFMRLGWEPMMGDEVSGESAGEATPTNEQNLFLDLE